MGAGHDAVADELADRLRARGHSVLIKDVLALLPSGVGTALRTVYRGTVRHAPQLYAAVYGAFLATGPERAQGAATVPRPGSAPLAALAEGPFMKVVDNWQPDAVISTFHLSAQVTGRLRARGGLRVPSVVAVIDFAVHRGWLHPGNDAHLCITEAGARTVRAVTGRAAEATGPVVPRRFSEERAGEVRESGRDWGKEFELLAPGRPAVLLSAGAWGVGSELPDTARQLAVHGVFPVLMCGNDERLRRRAASLPGTLALGWVTDVAGLMSAAHALIDNAAGQTAAQALAARLPVIGYRPLPGHGAEGIRAMAEAGVSELACDQQELVDVLDSLLRPGPLREKRLANGRALFRVDAAQRISEIAQAGVRAA
ncbi:MAG TPA: galactosyldiacylglycerol synthase [Streptomyces sp.]|nr:galactosyldiacylglycerol synthase [Streptomyces sp.]